MLLYQKKMIVYIALLLVAGCSTVDRPNIPKVFDTSLVIYQIEGDDGLTKHREKYEAAILQNKEADAKYWRDTMINLTRRDIETFYRIYENILYSSRRDITSIVDVITLSSVTAATIVNDARSKTVITALAALLQGANAKIDQNTFRDNTTTVIIQKMRATRTRVDVEIQRKTELSARQYTFPEAEKDLRNLFWSGTLLGGFLELAIDTGNDAKNAQKVNDKVIDDRVLIVKVTPEQRQLATEIRKKRESLESAWVENKESETGKAALQEAFNAVNAIFKATALPGTTPQSLPKDAKAEEVFGQLRNEIEKAITKRELLPIIAKELGIK